MRDLAIFLILAALAWAAWLWPWVGVLGLAVLAYMNPHSYGVGFMSNFPVYQTLFAVVGLSLGWDAYRRGTLPKPPWDWRLLIFLLLWVCFFFTTWHSQFPWSAWIKLSDISKIFLALLPTLLLIDSRRKLFFLIITIAISFGLVTLKGGYWAVMTGFQDRVYGPPGSHFYGNNEFAVAMAMNIPLLALWLREARHGRLRWILMALVGLSYAAVLSSWSRGGLITLGVTSLFLLWSGKRRQLMLPLLLAGGVLAITTLPAKWFERMGTISTYEQDASATSRLDAWRIGFAYAREHPLTGAGFDGWIAVQPDPEHPIAWHSSYVQIVTEHGLLGLTLWSLLIFGSMLALTRIIWQAGRSRAPPWAGDYAVMLRASLAAYAAGGLFLGLAYWDIPYHLIILSVLLGHLGRREAGAGAKYPATP
ncbi:MAG: putative O-glycosylation ligase, exosortase A system-associated [Gallionellaceae bacterium]|nr:putative O-glycosylation ligase, exosortase A system-associated [Gallionellaceae bacterium]